MHRPCLTWHSWAGPTVGPAPGNRSGRASFAAVSAGAFSTSKKLSFEPGHVGKLAAAAEIQPWRLGLLGDLPLACSAQHQHACPAAAHARLVSRPSGPCSKQKGLSNEPGFTLKLALAAELWAARSGSPDQGHPTTDWWHCCPAPPSSSAGRRQQPEPPCPHRRCTCLAPHTERCAPAASGQRAVAARGRSTR